MQLREKQKARRFYGVLESQFAKYFDMATSQKGVTGENLLAILETRMDNVIYRMGLSTSRAEARQLVRHGQFQVNGRRVDIPSYLVSVGDEITVCDRFKATEKIKSIVDSAGSRVVPKWLDYSPEEMKCKVVQYPGREDVDIPIKEHLIVELYSK
jgi:small subunit ribosomal protein S4